METEAMPIGVVMQRHALMHRWQPFAWKPIEIIDAVNLPDHVPHDSPLVRCLRQDENDAHWLFGGLEVRLFSDEAEGYFLNISSPTPCWFIMWRLEEVDGIELAVPKSVTLSYNEAARLMDGGESVDTLLLSDAITARLTAFTHTHYHPQPKKKQRKPSFEGGAGVEQMAQQEGSAHGRR
jgi:hypothetical protein